MTAVILRRVCGAARYATWGGIGFARQFRLGVSPCWDRLFFPFALSLSKGAFVLRRCNGNCPRIVWILDGFLGFPVRSP